MNNYNLIPIKENKDKESLFENTSKNLEEKSIELELYKCLDSYLGKINISNNNCYKAKNNSNNSYVPKMIIILDVSGSMFEQLGRIVQKIIPKILNDIYGLNTSYSVSLITFSDYSDVKIYEGNAKLISQLNLYADGPTYMSPAIDTLYEMILNRKNKNEIYRILTISDGELHDQEKTMESADKLKQLFQKENLIINSQSIRLFTSSDEPDTRGLSSMLQLSTNGKQMLIDIDTNSSNDEKISKLISDLFIDDGLGDSAILESKLNDICLQEEPWSSTKNSIYIFPGMNSFWIKLKNDKKDICNEIENNLIIKHKNEEISKIKCVIKEDVSAENYQELIKDKIDFYFKQLKVLKVVNTKESKNEMDKMIEFFNNLEENIFLKNSLSKSKTQFKLYERAQALKSIILRRKLSLANKMREIKNDDKINQLNSRQQAEYLREIDINDRTGKSLAKRALDEGIDFDDIARKEVKQIAEHIKELDSVDESKLTVSFYSTCNTLDGIKAVCSFYEENSKNNLFEEVTANDIIKLINIVGVAAYSTIGNFPDPMTYRLKALYPGTFVSLSDILIAYEVTRGENLKEIGTKNEINTTIPYFEDEKIGNFLIKYAPKLLEYSASIGMRRILAEVQYTHEYTILSGLWAMIPILLKDKKEINIKIFTELCRGYLISAGEHFNYVLDLLDKQKKMDENGMSLYIGNNGITNMFSPILKYLIKNKGKETDEMMKRIVRACYQFEIYQYTKKNIKLQNTSNPEQYVQEVLIDLLKIDLEKDKTFVPELFEPVTKDPIFSDKYEINEKKFNEIMSKVWWGDYILITPLFLKASLSEDPVSEFKKIEIDNITEEIIQERLGINYNSKLFKLYCIVQAYLQHEQSDRVDFENEKMKIIDLSIKDKAEKYIRDFIQSLFIHKYEFDLKKRANQEQEEIAKLLADKIVNAKDLSEFKNLLKNGI